MIKIKSEDFKRLFVKNSSGGFIYKVSNKNPMDYALRCEKEGFDNLNYSKSLFYTNGEILTTFTELKDTGET